VVKHTGKFVAYYRVSTKQQGASGLGLEAQQRAVRDYLNGGDWELLGEFTEVESGRKLRRPRLLEAIAMCRQTGARLVIARLDRLARNVYFISMLAQSGVEFVCCDMPQADRFTIHILAAVAEKEAEMIASRTRAGLQAAKARGVILGGTDVKKAAQAAGAASSEMADDHARRVGPILDQIQRAGFTSLRDIARALNARGVPTARTHAAEMKGEVMWQGEGKSEWGPSAVRNTLQRWENIRRSV
jgi:DNA invertase Pin-like site-specific DNA recombinase